MVWRLTGIGGGGRGWWSEVIGENYAGINSGGEILVIL